jgi:hypothetical protein
VDHDHVVNPCPICGSSKQIYHFEIHNFSVTSCEGCRLAFSSPSTLPHLSDRFSVHPEKIGDGLPEGKTELEAGKKYLQILTGRSADIRNILLIAEAGHYFAAMAKEHGVKILRHMSIGELEKEIGLSEAVDAVVIIYQLEKANAIDRI